MIEKNNKKEDLQPKQQITQWHCDTYCRKIRHITCEGKDNVNENAPDLCPYFEEMLY